MDTQIVLALINLAGILAALAASSYAAWLAYLSKITAGESKVMAGEAKDATLVTASKVAALTTIARENSIQIELVHLATNSMKDALVAQAGTIGRAEGKAEQKAKNDHDRKP